MTRNVLFSFVGETPQVVTETLYFLLEKWGIRDGVVHLLTTSEDKEEKKIKTNSLDLVKSNGWIHRFNDAYKTRWEPCDDSVFVWEQKGVQILPFDDIYKESDNDKAIDVVTRIIYYWTIIQKDVRLFVSLAGGRKQLGSYMYQSLSWFGSPSIKLCHVIPSKYFEKIAKNKSWGDIQWVDGYFPKPGAGSSPKERAEKAFGRKEINFVEQPVIFLRGLLPPILDFNNCYLDNENKAVSGFPFSGFLEDYLTYNNISNRYKFMQGLVKNSPDEVTVYLDLKNNKFVVESNGLIKSFMPKKNGNPYNRLSYYFLFYFLYKIKGCSKDESIPYNKNIFMKGCGNKDKSNDVEDEESDRSKGKYLVEWFDQALSEFLNREKFDDAKYNEVFTGICDEINELKEKEINKVAKIIVEGFIGYNIYSLRFQESDLHLGKLVYKKYIDRIGSAITFLEKNPATLGFLRELIENNPIDLLKAERIKVTDKVESHKHSHEILLKTIANDINNIFSELSRQIEDGIGINSGLKINIFVDNSKPSFRYLEVDDPETLLVRLHGFSD